MTEAEFLTQTAKDFEAIASELAAFRAQATEETWQEVCPKNGWTRAQVLEHMCRAVMPCEGVIAGALAKAEPDDGSGSIGFARFVKAALRKLYPIGLPAPKSLLVAEPIDGATALAHWDACEKLVRGQIEEARGKSLTRSRFRNPILPAFKISLGDYFAVQIEHLRHHAAQVYARAQG